MPSGTPSSSADLDEAVALEVMQHEDGALLDPESPEAALQLVAVEHAGQLIVAGPVAQGHLADLHRMPAAGLASLAVAAPDEHPMEPGVEAVGIAQRGQVAPRGDERLLRGVGGTIRVAQDQLRQPVQAADLLAGDHVERPRSPSIARSTSLRSIRPPTPRA